MIKKFDKFNEGSETVGMVGSGTAISGYPTGRFTNSAGQAVYGGDSASSFAGNSNLTRVKTEVPVGPLPIFKNIKKRKKKKDKEERLNNQLGKDIDSLYKPIEKTNNESMIKKFDEFSKLNEDGEGGGGGGVSSATLGNTGGMGAIVSAQPSSIPGDVAGSTKGSGDIGCRLGTYTKQPAGIYPKQQKRKKKKKKETEKKGEGIDNFYVTNYKESTNNGNIIQSWKVFTEQKINESVELKIGNKYLYKKDGEELTVHISDIEDNKITLAPIREIGKIGHGSFKIDKEESDKLFKISW